MLPPPTPTFPVMFGRPNITGTKSGFVYKSAGPTGACYITQEDPQYIDGVSQVLRHVNFSANRASSLYGNSSTVQPPSVQVMPCIKL